METLIFKVINLVTLSHATKIKDAQFMPDNIFIFGATNSDKKKLIPTSQEYSNKTHRHFIHLKK